jgi:hypothetical protein
MQDKSLAKEVQKALILIKQMNKSNPAQNPDILQTMAVK